MSLLLTDRATGEVTFDGARVSRSLRCPICSHLHREQSWCLVDTVRGLAICPRVESKRKIGEAGFLHRIDGADPAAVPAWQATPRQEATLENLGHLQRRYRAALTVDLIQQLADRWGTSMHSIERIGCGWDGSAWTFPMHDEDGKVIGYRRRLPDGSKLCRKGSRLGLLMPTARRQAGSLFVVEGESDLAAALDLRVDAIARPGCRVCESMVRRIGKGRDIVIVADKDAPGMEGARALRKTVLPNARSAVIVQPPGGHKDLREWVRAGGNREALRFIVESMRGF
jgi:hypothetical protein